MILIQDYKSNDPLRKSFDKLANLVFGISLEEWFTKGFWNDSYKCHSLVEDGVVISNVSTTHMNLVLNGQKRRAIQLGTVMTHPDFRNKGLAATLMKTVLDHYQGQTDLFYLFPAEAVMQFYPKYGFTHYHDIFYTLETVVTSSPTSSITRVDIGNDFELGKFHDAVQSRRVISSTFDTLDCTSIYMWHCLNDLRENIYRINGTDNYLVLRQESEKIRLYDFVSDTEYPFTYILDSLGPDSQKEICLHFLPDELSADRWKLREHKNEDMFFRQITPSSTFSHQVMAHT